VEADSRDPEIGQISRDRLLPDNSDSLCAGGPQSRPPGEASPFIVITQIVDMHGLKQPKARLQDLVQCGEI
jgi:hypothetical protein